MRFVLVTAGLAITVLAVGCSTVDGTAVAGEAVPTATTTQPTTTTASLPAADPADYRDTSSQVFFVTPDGLFDCGFTLSFDPPSTLPTSVGCYGKMPATAPKVRGSGAGVNVLIRPNAIEVDAIGPAQFISIGNPRFSPTDGSAARVLPYRTALTVGEFTCQVGETTGVTCTAESGSGFTISSSAFEVR